MSPAELALDALAEIVAAKVVERLSAGAGVLVDQASSSLGRRRHMAAVRRRVAAGEAGAAIVGRRYLLSKEAVETELAALSSKPKRKRAEGKSDPSPANDLEDLATRLGFERVAS